MWELGSIPPRTKELYQLLVDAALDDGWVQKSHADIATELEMAQSDVSRRIQDLINKGFMSRFNPAYQMRKATNVADHYCVIGPRYEGAKMSSLRSR